MAALFSSSSSSSYSPSSSSPSSFTRRAPFSRSFRPPVPFLFIFRDAERRPDADRAFSNGRQKREKKKRKRRGAGEKSRRGRQAAGPQGRRGASIFEITTRRRGVGGRNRSRCSSISRRPAHFYHRRASIMRLYLALFLIHFCSAFFSL